ncbi:RbsD/FucU domain-containing protein [Enemella evansiae]|uniref:RbsD/FucU domain-containing protein n=1 Tax=Enemella evansiae TaxID=2016499 RepID=UPI00105D57C8|nr:RbsD/FucU domain-containing protein [Enemella evansiae]TDO87942.1 L-fucose mutarotase [Enemella evansiae]
MTLLAPGARIIHPGILDALARVGHKGRILVCDALYSTATATNPRSRVVHLALTAGTPTVTEVVRTLAEAVEIEALVRMCPESGETGLPVHREIDALLPTTRVAHDWVDRGAFYDLARDREVALCLATGDTRRFANVLLTVGAPTVETP